MNDMINHKIRQTAYPPLTNNSKITLESNPLGPKRDFFGKIYTEFDKAKGNDSTITTIYSDGIPLFSAYHTRPVWYKRIWYAIKYLFIRPKFSQEAIERALEWKDEVPDNFGIQKK